MLRFIFVATVIASEIQERVTGEKCADAYARWLRTYETQSMADYATRMQHFCDNLNTPAPARKSRESARYAVWTSPLADMDREEFYAYYHLYENAKFLEADMAERELQGVRTRVLQQAPEAWDWTSAVQPVQNQKSCGSCWAFSIVGCSEGAAAAKHNVYMKLSESFVLDCTYNHGGCRGGNMPVVMREIMNNDMVIPRIDGAHTYEPRDRSDEERAGICRAVDPTQGVKLVPYSPTQQVHSVRGEAPMRWALYQYGPIQVAIDASPLPMYHDNIISGDECNYNGLNHAVVLTAYSTDYYTIKNSWGTEWGDNGYFKIERGWGPKADEEGGCIGIGKWVNACKVEVVEKSEATDCVGSWGDWGACSATCGAGAKTRTYSVTTPAANGGTACRFEHGTTQAQPCSVSICPVPVDCQGDWGKLGQCTPSSRFNTCGAGRQTREFVVTVEPEHGGAACPAPQSQDCQIDCEDDDDESQDEDEDDNDDDTTVECSDLSKQECRKEHPGFCLYRRKAKCQAISVALIDMTRRKPEKWCNILRVEDSANFCSNMDQTSCGSKFDGVKVCK